MPFEYIAHWPLVDVIVYARIEITDLLNEDEYHSHLPD